MLRFSQLMIEFSHHVGIGEVNADEKNHYLFHVDDMAVNCFEVNNRIYLQAAIVALPNQEFEQLDRLKSALKLALANPMPSKVSLTIDEHDHLILFDRFPEMTVELEKFDAWFGDFLDCVEMFQKYLGESAKPTLHAQSSTTEQIFIG